MKIGSVRIIFILLFGCFKCILNNVLRADNIEANHLVLYDSASTSMADQQFTIIFNVTSFTTLPTFAFGINNYELADRFFY